MYIKLLVTFLLTFIVQVNVAQKTAYNSVPEDLFRTGLELLDKNNFAAARSTFERYLEQAPQGARKADAQYYVAFAALNLYHRDGEKLIAKFIDAYPNHPKSSLAYLELGNLYFQDQDFNKAAEYLSKVRLSLIGKNQRDETRFKLGYAYFAQRKFDKAIDFFNALKRESGAYGPASNYYAGYIAYEQKQYDEAITDLKKAEQDPAYKSVVPGMLADLYYKQGRYDELLAYSQQVLNSGTRVNQRDFYLLAAEALSKKSNYEEAVTYYNRYQQGIQNPPVDVRYRIGYANYKVGNNEKAINEFKQVASTADEIGVYASYYLGVLYLKEGNKIYAITAFDNARRSKLNTELSEESAFQYVKVSYDLGRIEEAIEGARAYLEKYPQSKNGEEIGDLLSSAYLNSNNYNLAIEYIERQPNPNTRQKAVYQKATFLKGMDLFNKGDYRQAITVFNKSLKYPLDIKFKAQASLWIGEAYSVGRKYKEAIPYYQQTLNTTLPKQDPVIKQAHYGLGYAYYNTKQYSNALSQFDAYVQKTKAGEGYYDDALLRLADCFYVSKNYSSALKNYKKAIEINRVDNDYAHLQAGIVNSLQGNVNAAIGEFNYIIRNFSQSRYIDDALFRKAQLNFEGGNYQRAVQEFTDLIQKKPTSQFVPYAYMRRASSNYNLKNYQKSIDDYTTVLNQFSSHSVAEEALLPLQEVLNLQGKSDQFDQYLANYKKANPDKKGLESIEFETAKNQYFNLNYNKAIESFKSYIRTYSESGNVPEAKYYIAESYYRLTDNENALKYYNEILASGKYNPLSKVINRIAELEFKSKRYENAIYFYYQLVGAAQTKKEQYYAWSGLMESYYNLNRYDSTKHYAEIILAKGNVNISSQNKASLYLGKAAMKAGDLENAQDEFINTLNTAKDEYGAEAQYLLGELLYKQGQYQKSIEALIELNNSFNIYKEWVGKSYLLLADNYVALEDYFQAKGTLQSIIEKFPLESFKQKAKQKLQSINETQGARKDGEKNKSDTLIFDN